MISPSPRFYWMLRSVKTEQSPVTAELILEISVIAIKLNARGEPQMLAVTE